MEKNNQGKEILKLIQDNYDIKSAQDLSSALKDMFKGALQEMMNLNLIHLWVILNMIKQKKKLIIEMVQLKRY